MKLPKGVYQRNKSSPKLWISYMDENGKRILESAHTTDPSIAENYRNLRLAKVSARTYLSQAKQNFEKLIFKLSPTAAKACLTV